jgi:nicotinamide mononucleotide transporter
MISWLEVASNAVNAGSMVLAARNSIHTWWTGIAGCGLFAVLFYESQLYADVALQGFFIVTSVYGWRARLGRERG